MPRLKPGITGSVLMAAVCAAAWLRGDWAGAPLHRRERRSRQQIPPAVARPSQLVTQLSSTCCSLTGSSTALSPFTWTVPYRPGIIPGLDGSKRDPSHRHC